jgi:hypothetical protein
MYCQSNNWWRFRKILWPSQNIRILLSVIAQWLALVLGRPLKFPIDPEIDLICLSNVKSFAEFKFCAKKAMEVVEDNADGDVVDHDADDAREDSKEDGKVEDNESYSDQYRTEILERHVTRIDRPRSIITSVTLRIRKYIRNNNNNNSNNTDFESHEGNGNHKSKLCQSIGKLTINIISGIFVSIAAMVIWTVVGTYFAANSDANSDNTTNITTASTTNTTSIFQMI